MEDEELIKQILYKLDGWKLDNEVDNEDLLDTEFNKIISSEEVLHFYNVAYNYGLSYTKLSEFPTITFHKNDEEITELNPQINNALILWTAGLLYRKYNIRSNDQIDDTMTIGYGDSLIIQAKEILKTVKGYSFNAY